MHKTLLSALLLALCVYSVAADACTTIIAGKLATADGSIIIARNEDTGDATETQNMAFFPARKEAGIFVGNSISNPENNTFTFTLPPNALGYVAFPHWQSMGKKNLSFAETGINQYGVAISATETIFNSDKALKTDPYLLKTGLTEDSITSVILPYAVSAKDGAQLLGRMIEQMGAGEGFGVAFSDRNEVWYLETASGHHWLAQRIPDQAVFVSANQGRFQQVNLNDPMQVLASPGLLDFAVKNGLYDPAQGPFNFFTCCISDTPHDHTYNYPRVRELQRFFSGIKYTKDDGLYPVFVQPDRKLTLQDLKQALRNRYNGTSHDPYQNRNAKESYRPVTVMRTALSHITQTRPDLPADIAVVQHIAIGMTDLSIYIPFHAGLSELPKGYQGNRGTIADDSLFWQYRKLQALVLQDYPRLAPQVHQAINAFEKQIAARQKTMEKAYMKLFRQDLNKAAGLINKFTHRIIAEQETLIKKLTTQVATQLGKQGMTIRQYEQLINETEKMYHFHGA